MADESVADGMNWEDELAKALEGLFAKKGEGPYGGGNACADKLAYLAYTGKIENFVRDELAYRLQQGRGIVDAARREFRAKKGGGNQRIDLVVHGAQSHFLQTKAIYLGDLVSGPRTAKNWRSSILKEAVELRDDLFEKVGMALNSDHLSTQPRDLALARGLLLVTDIPSPVSADPKEVLAYKAHVLAQESTPVGPARLSDIEHGVAAQLKLQASSPNLNLSGRQGTWTGQAFGVDVHVHWFLVRPF